MSNDEISFLGRALLRFEIETITHLLPGILILYLFYVAWSITTGGWEVFSEVVVPIDPNTEREVRTTVTFFVIAYVAGQLSWPFKLLPSYLWDAPERDKIYSALEAGFTIESIDESIQTELIEKLKTFTAINVPSLETVTETGNDDNAESATETEIDDNAESATETGNDDNDESATSTEESRQSEKQNKTIEITSISPPETGTDDNDESTTNTEESRQPEKQNDGAVARWSRGRNTILHLLRNVPQLRRLNPMNEVTVRTAEKGDAMASAFHIIRRHIEYRYPPIYYKRYERAKAFIEFWQIIFTISLLFTIISIFALTGSQNWRVPVVTFAVSSVVLLTAIYRIKALVLTPYRELFVAFFLYADEDNDSSDLNQEA